MNSVKLLQEFTISRIISAYKNREYLFFQKPHVFNINKKKKPCKSKKHYPIEYK
jgi:hypothetical protein